MDNKKKNARFCASSPEKTLRVLKKESMLAVTDMEGTREMRRTQK